MKVRLISYSSPSNEMTEAGVYTLADQVAYCARVSNPSNQGNKDNEKLIRYLIDNHHWSPLEMVSLCLEIETTRDIARQILRHRSFSFQEFSQRYADPTKELDFVTRETRTQDTKNRQNSIVSTDAELAADWELVQQNAIEFNKRSYEWAIERGIAKEQARAVLPEGLTVSRLYMSGTLRSWFHYISLRRANGTQEEHRQVAEACREVVSSVFPLIEKL